MGDLDAEEERDTEGEDGGERLYTQDEVDTIVAKRLAREIQGSQSRARRPGAAPSPPSRGPSARRGSGGDDLSSMVRDLVSLQVAQTVSAFRPAPLPAGPPVSGNGAPPPPPSLGASEDTPIWRLSEEERAHLLKTKGAQHYRERYYRNLRGTKIKVRNY
jgi:hypothetical protein